MPLSPKVKEAFDQWARTETWCKGNLPDETGFYKFVWAVIEYSKKRPTETEINDLLIEKWEAKFDRKYLENCARKYSGLYVNLLEFHDCRRK